MIILTNMKMDRNCYDLEGNLFPYCIKELWKEAGCVTEAPLEILRDKTKDEIIKLANKASNSKESKKWAKCYGDSTNRGFGSTVSYNKNVNQSCKGFLRNEGELISCKECFDKGKRREGIWLYKDGRRFLIPNCQCRSAYVAGNLTPEQDGDYDTCSQGYQKWKTMNKITNDCEIREAWDNPDNTWFYEGKDIVKSDIPGTLTNNTIFFANKDGIFNVPEGKCNINCGEDKINICDLNKLKSCRGNKSECIEKGTKHISSKIKPTDLPAKCWYSIPVANGLGESFPYYIGNVRTNFSAMNCDKPDLYNSGVADAALYIGDKIGHKKITKKSSFIANRLYTFRGSKYYRLKTIGENFTLEASGQIRDTWKGQIPSNIDAIFINSTDSLIYIFKGDDYYAFDPFVNKVSSAGKINKKFRGIPNNLDSAVQFGGRTIFFKNNNYYEIKHPTLLQKAISIPSQQFSIINFYLGLAIEIPLSNNWNTTEGTVLRLATPNGGDNQKWVYDPFTKNIINPASGFCLAILEDNVNNINNGLPIVLSRRDDSPNKKWKYIKPTGNYIGARLQLIESKKFISYQNSQKQLYIWEADKTNPERQCWSKPFGYNRDDWKISQIINKNSGMALSISNSKSDNTSNLQNNGCPQGFVLGSGCNNDSSICCVSHYSPDCGEICAIEKCAQAGGKGIPKDYSKNLYTCQISQYQNLKVTGYKISQEESSKNTPNQWWIYDTISKQIINPSSGFCLEIKDGIDKNDSIIQTNTRIARDGYQQWKWEPNNKYLSLVFPAASKRCLYVYGGSKTADSPIYLYDKNGWSSEMWSQPMGNSPNKEGGVLFLYSGLTQNNEINNSQVDNGEAMMKRDKSFINDFKEAVEIANSLGGRVATEYEVRLITSKSSNSPFGWTGKNDNYTLEGNKIKIENNTAIIGTRKDLAGVWIWSSSGSHSLHYQGEKICSDEIYPTDKPEWKDDHRAYIPSKIHSLCSDLGGCYKKEGTNNYCYTSQYQAKLPQANLISEFNSGIPNYLNASFVVDNRLYLAKSNLIYIIEGSDSIKSEDANIVFEGYPKVRDLLKYSINASKNEENEQTKSFNIKLDRLRSDKNVIIRGRQAIGSTEIVLTDQKNRNKNRNTKLGNLDKTNSTLLRQTTINDNTFQHRLKFNSYLKSLLAFSLVQIILALALRNPKFKMIKLAIQLILIIAILVYLLPSLWTNLRNSKMRWNLKNWNVTVPSVSKDDEDEGEGEDSTDMIKILENEVKNNTELKIQCEAIEKSKNSKNSKSNATLSLGIGLGNNTNKSNKDDDDKSLEIGLDLSLREQK